MADKKGDVRKLLLSGITLFYFIVMYAVLYYFLSSSHDRNRRLLIVVGGKTLNILLNELEKGILYLHSQGKVVNKIKMNPTVYENFIKLNPELMKDDSHDPYKLLGIDVEEDETVEKYEFIMNN